MSYYLKSHRAEYYDRLTAIRTDGNWEGWLKFFLRGAAEVSQSATDTARAILDLRENNRQRIIENAANIAANGLKLLDYLYAQPIVTVKIVETFLQSTFRTANKLIEQFVKLYLLEEMTGQRRNRVYIYKPYMDLFNKPIIESGSEK